MGEEKAFYPELFIDQRKVKSIIEIDTEFTLVDEIGELYKIDATKEEKYLGDVISSDGKCDKNMKKRTEKG